MSDVRPDPLSLLVGTQLDAIQFVRDYIILGFGSLGLTAVTSPTVRLPSGDFAPSDHGYRAAICSLIGGTVVSASEDGRAIRLGIAGERLVAISLLLRDSVDIEAALLRDSEGGLTVWQVGEE